MNTLEQGLLETLRAMSPAPRPAGGASQVRWFRAPGRTELGGNHTDHNHGRVLAGSISLSSIAAVLPRADRQVRIHAEGYEPFTVDLDHLNPRPEEAESSAALVRGVAAWLRAKGHEPGGFDAAIASTVLRGSGLSSSASFEVLVGGIFNGLWLRDALDPLSLSMAGQYAENSYFGKPSGLMDQVACAYGGVVAIDFQDPAQAVVEQVSLDLASHGYALTILSTGDDHADLTAEYAAIPQEMKSVAAYFGKPWLRGLRREQILDAAPALRDRCGDRAVLRALHFVDEDQRPPLMVQALRNNDFPAYLDLVRASGASSARLLQNLHAPQSTRSQCMDLALEMANHWLGREGAARVHGGGFGGTIQAYVPRPRVSGYAAWMERVFGIGSVSILDISPTGIGEYHPA